jgi:glycosyltransferase involved in cell wall biosynthesis
MGDELRKNSRKVVIFQRVIPSYRVAFFQELDRLLGEEGIELEIAAGQPWTDEALVDARSCLNRFCRCKNIRLAGNLYWQSGAWAAARGADLVVFEQANAALINYAVILRRLFFKSLPLTAHWGHGAHLHKAGKQILRDGWKKFWLNKVDHWFAYTKHSLDLIIKAGFPIERTTVVQNAIDTAALRNARAQLSNRDSSELFESLFRCSRTPEHRLGIYCARLTPLKNIPFLLQAAELVHEQLPQFKMIIVGDGALRDTVKQFVDRHPWCVWVGALHGLERVRYLALGDVWLNPGMTGLSILDSFALGIPFATTDCGIHSPEIAYLQPGRNGLLTAPNVDTYSSEIKKLLLSDTLNEWADNAREDGKQYTVEAMARNFSNGIRKSLEG